MLSRRELFTAGMAGGLASPLSPSAAPPVEQERDLQVQKEIASHLGSIDDTLERSMLSSSLSFGVIGKVRVLMEQFLRAHQKFPDYFEIGIGVFIELYDWHVKNRQELTVARLADGRYTMQFMFSTMILRADQERDYVGYPYDRG